VRLGSWGERGGSSETLVRFVVFGAYGSSVLRYEWVGEMDAAVRGWTKALFGVECEGRCVG
jgi:hypothetical protein